MNNVMRKKVGWSLIAVSVLGLLWGLEHEAPYVIDSPGPVTNVLGSSDGTEIIQLNFSAEETVGSIDMLTVSGDGIPGDTPTYFEVLAALFSNDQAIFPIESDFPDGKNIYDFLAESRRDLETSIENALAAAQSVLPAGVVESSEVKIGLKDTGGPSAGLALALGVVDKLTPGSLTGGKSVAVTGTIDSVGVVGEIGGIRQKIFGAKRNGDDFFLVPAGNCRDFFPWHLELIRVVPVRDLNDALATLKVISADGDIDKLSTCSAK